MHPFSLYSLMLRPPEFVQSQRHLKTFHSSILLFHQRTVIGQILVWTLRSTRTLLKQQCPTLVLGLRGNCAPQCCEFCLQVCKLLLGPVSMSIMSVKKHLGLAKTRPHFANLWPSIGLQNAQQMSNYHSSPLPNTAGKENSLIYGYCILVFSMLDVSECRFDRVSRNVA